MRCEKEGSAKTQKGDQTKALILETALEIFQERGYEQTTMRAIAEKAKLSLGNAYYYFRSKEYLIQAFYHRTHEAHLAESLSRTRDGTDSQGTTAKSNAAEDRHVEALSRICRRAL